MIEISSVSNLASVNNWVTGLLGHFPAIGLFTLLILGGLGLPFPEDATLLLCGVFIATGITTPVHGLVASYAGLISMDLFLYYVGRKYGRKIVAHRRFKRFLTERRLSKLEGKFNKWGALFLFVGRQLVGLRAQIFLVSGILRLPFVKFIMTDMASAIITMAVMVSIGYVGGSSMTALSKDINKIGHIAVVLVVAFIFFFFFYKYIKRGRTPE